MKYSLHYLFLGGSLILAGCSNPASNSSGSSSSISANSPTAGAPPQIFGSGGSVGWSNGFQSISDSIDGSMRASQDRQLAAQRQMHAESMAVAAQENARREKKELKNDMMDLLPLVGILGVAAKSLNPSSPDCRSEEMARGWIKDSQKIFDHANRSSSKVPPT